MAPPTGSEDPGTWGSFNYHLQPSSPCVNALAASLAEPGSKDVDGQPRVIGDSLDIGADECQPSLILSTPGSGQYLPYTWPSADTIELKFPIPVGSSFSGNPVSVRLDRPGPFNTSEDVSDQFSYTWADSTKTLLIAPTSATGIDLGGVYTIQPAGAPIDAFTWERLLLPGDTNCDGAADVVDLITLNEAFNSDYDCRSDFNRDGAVDVADLLILVDNFGIALDGTCEECQPMLATLQGQRDSGVVAAPTGMTVYEALEYVGLLDMYLDYIAEHPEAARTW